MIVVIGIFHYGERFLIARRSLNREFALKWEFPGGKVEEGEIELVALRREFKEELDLSVRSARFFYEAVWPSNPDVKLRFYYIDMCDGDITLLDHLAISWETREEILNRSDLIDIEMINALNQIK